MVVLVTCENKEESIKNKGARVVTKFFACKSMEFVGLRENVFIFLQ